MPTRNINLTDHFDAFVAGEIDAGRYHNASEVMRAGLRLLEQQSHEDREKVALLKSLAKQAFQELDQGQGIELNGEAELTDLVRKLGRKAATSTKRQIKRG
ncbi:MAG: type II toxin-antitoxin system ParD family antitoxin [Pirellulales bacterium]